MEQVRTLRLNIISRKQRPYQTVFAYLDILVASSYQYHAVHLTKSLIQSV